MRKTLSLLILFLASTSLASTRPNVLLVLTDDQGIGDLACYGNPIIKTPALDKFSTESVNLMDFHVERSCAPTRASLMTGRICNATGLWYTITQRALVNKDESNIALQLKKSGYTTAMFGKWHMGDMKPYRPEDKGFDRVVRHGAGGIGQTSDYWGNNYFDDTYVVDGELKKYEGYCTDVFTDESIKFIRQAVAQNKPFFCYLATNAPHGPYFVADKYRNMYAKNKDVANPAFYGMITNIDENFQRLMDTLDELKIADNTLVIFMTDNGTASGITTKNKGFDGFVDKGYNMGMRGKKASAYDGGHRVPCIIRYPNGGLEAGKKIDTLTAHVDILPTILELCDTSYDGKKPLYGKSMVNLIKDDNETGFKGRILATDSHIIGVPPKWIRSAVMQDKFRLVKGEELYDVSKDPEQKNDISADMPEKVAELRDFYDNWYESIHQGENLKVNPIYVYKGETTLLDAHYMQPHNMNKLPAWDQSTIKKGTPNTGSWEIFVEEEGEYNFELRRYPEEFDKAIIWGDNKHKSLNITNASLSIDGEVIGESEVGESDKYISFNVKLKAGRHLVESIFCSNNINLSPYYIYIK